MDWKRLSKHLRILVMVRQVQGILSLQIEKLFEVFFYLFLGVDTLLTLLIMSSFVLNKNMACWQTQNVIAIGDQWIPAGVYQQ